MLSEIMLGQYFPGNSIIHHLDPRTKLFGTIFFIVGIFFAQSFICYGFLCACGIAVIFLARLPFAMVIKSLKPIWFIVLITALIHACSFPGQEILWQWQFIKITSEGLAMGSKMALRIILLLLFSSVLTFTTSPLILTEGIEKILRPLKKIGVPAHEIAMMMTIALRFIPTLLQETDRIIKAQKARGMDFNKGNIVLKIKNMLPLLVPLFIGAFRRADELAIAMEARCYHGGEGRTKMYELKYNAADYAAYIAMFIFIGIICVISNW